MIIAHHQETPLFISQKKDENYVKNNAKVCYNFVVTSQNCLHSSYRCMCLMRSPFVHMGMADHLLQNKILNEHSLVI